MNDTDQNKEDDVLKTPPKKHEKKKRGQAEACPLHSEESGLICVRPTLSSFYLGHSSLVPTQVRCDVMLELTIGESSLNLTEDFWSVWCPLRAFWSFNKHGFSFRG